jgi:TRAP-type C4-dicarboxylate transport system permease small subunit
LQKKEVAHLKFRLLAENLAKLLEYVGIVGLLFMLLVTVVDVIGAKVFLNPLRGGMELVGFGQIVAISCTMAIGLFFNRHISIELLVYRLSGRVQKHINLIVSFLGLILFILLTCYSCAYGLSLKKAGEISSSANIPFYPFAFIIAIGAAAASIYYLNDILHYFTGRSPKNESN